MDKAAEVFVQSNWRYNQCAPPVVHLLYGRHLWCREAAITWLSPQSTSHVLSSQPLPSGSQLPCFIGINCKHGNAILMINIKYFSAEINGRNGQCCIVCKFPMPPLLQNIAVRFIWNYYDWKSNITTMKKHLKLPMRQQKQFVNHQTLLYKVTMATTADHFREGLCSLINTQQFIQVIKLLLGFPCRYTESHIYS